MRGAEKLEEEGHGLGGHHGLRLLAGTAGDVGQRPGGLELEDSVVSGAEELDKPRYYSSLDNLTEYQC